MQEWAPQVAGGAGIRPGDRVLDVACGTGVLLVERLAGKEAGDALRAPFALGGPKRMAELRAAAGIKGARVALRPGRGRFPSIRTIVEVDVRDWLRIVGITLDEGLIKGRSGSIRPRCSPPLRGEGTT